MNKEVIEALRQTVASSYALIGQLHLCHWNVRGKSFFSLHDAFESQYTELFSAVDEIAERIRAIGGLAPGGLSSLAEMAGIKELPEDASADEMVEHLLEDHKKVLKDLAVAREKAVEANDAETEDMMIARTQVHEKAVWMLNSYLG
ncbi:Dps family protein [Roseimaritima sediminicola]|uniref:Dps family protein n=1 Tax=Roseimaritima sediminicola TaxID=2662066 RepID=UPI001298254D|nr:DNA starvation/stationary phase protection protein [Roseimaritima sediminicola]